MRRRDNLKFLLGGLVGFSSPAFAAAPHPVLWRVRRGAARTYILGFGDAKDRSWYTPVIQKAFQDSGEIWFEVPQRNPAAPPSPAPPKADKVPDPGASERNLFDLLPPDLSRRLLAAAQKYDVPRERLEHVKVWRAFFVLNNGFLAKTDAGKANLENFADIVLSRMAYADGKTVRSEFATGADAMAHFVNMPEAEAVERLDFLLTYLDDDTAGMPDRYGWIEGRNNTRGIDRMRTRWPLLYQDEQVSRNVAWARRIDGFLRDGGTRFVVIGLQHTLGPDSLPVQLRKLGLHPETI